MNRSDSRFIHWCPIVCLGISVIAFIVFGFAIHDGNVVRAIPHGIVGFSYLLISWVTHRAKKLINEAEENDD